MPLICKTAIVLAAGVIAGHLVGEAEAQGMPQKVEAPSFLDDEGKEIFNDLEGEEEVYGAYACELREKLLKKMAGKEGNDAIRGRMQCLLGMGACEIQNEDYPMAIKRLDSAIGEMGLPNEDAVLQNPGVAHVGLLKISAKFLQKLEVTQASTAFRKTREVVERSLKKYLKMAHKQLGQQQQGAQNLPVEAIYDEIPGYGRTGQYIPKILPMLPGLKGEFALLELVEKVLDKLDKRMAVVEPSLKEKKIRLMSKSKTGSLLYVRALPAEAIIPAERSAVAQDLQALSGNFAKEASKLDKGVNLIKRGKEASGCKDSKHLPKTCTALKKMSDLFTNGFGETRVVMVKPKSKTQLDACTTNANIGVLLAAADGATLKVANVADPVPLPKGEPVVVDFCREASLESTAAVPVLFAQAWHPEFAAVERTTELRARAKSFGLSEDEVKTITKSVNDNAKKPWEKAATLWRTNSESHSAIRQAFENSANEKKKDESEEETLDESADDEEKKKAFEELEKKRAAKRKKDEEAEQARIKRKKQLEEERANRDPWLNAPAVAEAEKKVEELKEARREANAKLEFDLSTQLTKDISAAERALKKEIKKARKEFKKTGKVPAAAAGSEDSPASSDDGDSSSVSSDDASRKSGGSASAGEKEALQEKLKDVKKRKAEAVDSENFKEAQQLKKEQKELESNLEKLEL